MTRKQEETKKIKEILKFLPYRIKIRHGIGTGSGWIKVYIPKSVWELEKKNVELLIATALARPIMGENYILVNWYE